MDWLLFWYLKQFFFFLYCKGSLKVSKYQSLKVELLKKETLELKFGLVDPIGILRVKETGNPLLFKKKNLEWCNLEIFFGI